MRHVRHLHSLIQDDAASRHGLVPALSALSDDFADQASVLACRVRSVLELFNQACVSIRDAASRCISYNMPAYRGKRVFFYFSAFKKHIGIYPPSKDAALLQELAPYRGEKGNLSFPLNQPLPLDLIGSVAVALHREYELR